MMRPGTVIRLIASVTAPTLSARCSNADEYDEPEPRALLSTSGDSLIPGETHIADVNENFALELPTDDYTTIGGFVFGALGRLPQVGDRVVASGRMLTVREMEGRRIKTLALGGDDASGARETNSPVA